MNKCEEIETLVNGWIRLNLTAITNDDYDRDLWILERVYQILQQDADLSWAIISKIILKDSSGELSHVVGGGILRDFINEFPGKAESYIEDNLDKIPGLNECLAFSKM